MCNRVGNFKTLGLTHTAGDINGNKFRRPLGITHDCLCEFRCKNIKEERTFTSMTDKVLFLCELAWEMHRTEELKLNYRLFPERIRDIFGDRVKEAEMDHWRFDLTGQTLLVRDAEGNYSFAHRGLVEYFSAYRLLAQMDALAPEFADRYREDGDGTSLTKALQQRTSTDPHAAWGAAPFHPNLAVFLAEMASGAQAPPAPPGIKRLKLSWPRRSISSISGGVGPPPPPPCEFLAMNPIFPR